MVTFIVFVAVLFAPLCIFSPDASSDTRAFALIFSLCITLPVWLIILRMCKSSRTTEGKKTISQNNKRQKTYENKYGVIEWKDKE